MYLTRTTSLKRLSLAYTRVGLWEVRMQVLPVAGVWERLGSCAKCFTVHTGCRW